MKKELRSKYIKERNNLSEEYRKTAAEIIFEKLEALDIFTKAESIFVYVGFGSEIGTENFIKKYIDKKKIFVPKIVNKEMKVAHINKWSDLSPGHFNVLEPKTNNFYSGKIDLVITPSIVFSKDGYRLGYGKGYYDKYFSSSDYMISVGLSYDKLLKDSVPKEEHDKRVDCIITEKEILVYE